MIKANHNYWGKLFFSIYSRVKLKKQFQNIHFKGEFEDNGLSVLIVANHFSWWDGFIQLQLNEHFIKRQFHVIMLEKQLRKFMILNKAGAYSVQKNSRELIKSLQYTIDLLSDNKNVVLLFPQGEIQSLYTQEFKFESGLEYILKNKQEDVQLVFNVNLIDYFSEKKPTLTVYFKNYNTQHPVNLRTIENHFNDFASECKLQQKAK
jgi:1-acyl-sn-glycerol-3-phosphate acyltransferase